LSAAKDAYLHKVPRWNSLISLSRDRHSLLDEKLPSSELTIFRWMSGLLGERFLEANPEFGNLVWGLDDMNPFTGVCHYSGSCRGFESDCSECPAVRKPFEGKVEINLEQKIHFADRHKPTYVAPTDWINGEFQKSRLGQLRDSRKILNPLQSRFFEGQEAVTQSSNHLRALIVAANLDDPTKGVWDVTDSLNRFLDKPNFELTMIGRYSKKLSSSLPRAKFTGPLDSGSVMQRMREHDVLLVPSLFENAGTVVAEAASQGLPTIAREVGGMPEMTNHGESGYLFQTNEELDEILDSLSNKELSSKGISAKEWAQQLKPELIATQYAEAFL
jgi:glycosyltransferase involved in cell wall biosynthesis